MSTTVTHSPDYRQVSAAAGAISREEIALREALKRCSPATIDAACRFRRSHDLALVPAIVRGVIEHYVDSETCARLYAGRGELRLEADLGLDSLTMMEIVMLAEDALPITIPNEDLRQLGTLAEFERFIAARLREAGAAPAAMPLTAAPASAG